MIICNKISHKGGIYTKKVNNNEHIIAALLSTTTITEAAEIAGVSAKTIHARLKDQNFKNELDKARRELWKGYATSLQGRLGRAIQTISEIMDNEEAPPQVRLNASAEIIRSGMRITELVDVVERVDALEKIVEESQI